MVKVEFLLLVAHNLVPHNLVAHKILIKVIWIVEPITISKRILIRVILIVKYAIMILDWPITLLAREIVHLPIVLLAILNHKILC